MNSNYILSEPYFKGLVERKFESMLKPNTPLAASNLDCNESLSGQSRGCAHSAARLELAPVARKLPN